MNFQFYSKTFLTFCVLLTSMPFSMHASEDGHTTTNSPHCPNLQGTYRCVRGSHVSVKDIVKTELSYQVVSDGQFFEYFIDGKDRSIPDTDSMANGVYSAICKNQKIQIQFKADLMYEGSVIGKQTSQSEFSAKDADGKTVTITTQSKVGRVKLPTHIFECNRQN